MNKRCHKRRLLEQLYYSGDARLLMSFFSNETMNPTKTRADDEQLNRFRQTETSESMSLLSPFRGPMWSIQPNKIGRSPSYMWQGIVTEEAKCPRITGQNVHPQSAGPLMMMMMMNYGTATIFEASSSTNATMTI
mmetsp:Transcript_1909/g.4214  ORF Transcript_1909/g.4214 Transcript_1909/m.4214 type:complete len:135 (-) Transcript_1909:78-482(-)